MTTDPVFALVTVALLLTLLVATLMPAPRHPAEDDAGLGFALIASGGAAALAMGIVALLGYPIASAVLGAVAWLLVMPCIWLARAPQQQQGGWYDEEDDGDDGGSPSPDAPSAPPVPGDRLPGLQPAATQPALATWTPAPQAAPVIGVAARVQQLLAEQETERLLAAQEVERILAAAPVVPAAAPAAGEPVLEPAIAPLHKPDAPRLRPAPRVRADHPSIAHVLAAVAHARTRRRAAAKAQRRDTTASLRD